MKNNKKINREIIVVESSPKCLLNCKNCLLKYRKNKIKLNPRLGETIIKHIPFNTELQFRGTGEPLIKESQEIIKEILSKRKDLLIHIQTSGMIKLTKQMIKHIKRKQLKITLSYDDHHRKNKNYQLKIQPEYVNGISIATSKSEKLDVLELKKFKNLKVIDIDVLFSSNFKKVIGTSKRVIEIASNLAENFKETFVYITLFPSYQMKFPKYSQRILSQKYKQITDFWLKHEKGFYIFTGELKADRILPNGEVIPKENPYIALEEDITDNKNLPTIKERYKITSTKTF